MIHEFYGADLFLGGLSDSPGSLKRTEKNACIAESSPPVVELTLGSDLDVSSSCMESGSTITALS